MPYNPASDEYFWGKCFARDGSDYDPNYPSPKLSDAYRVLKRHFSHDTVFQVAICGKLRYGLTSVGGYSDTIDLQTLEAFATNVGLSGRQVTHGGGGISLEKKIKDMFGLGEEPEHVTGIFFHALD